MRAPTIAGYTRGTTVSGRETRCTGAGGRRAEHVETVGTAAAVVGAALVDVNRACWSGEARPGAIARVGVTIVDTGSAVMARAVCTGGIGVGNSTQHGGTGAAAKPKQASIGINDSTSVRGPVKRFVRWPQLWEVGVHGTVFPHQIAPQPYECRFLVLWRGDTMTAGR